jgi:hypothetical protein
VREGIKAHPNENCLFINAKDDFNYYHMKKNKSFDIDSINSESLKGKDYRYYKGKKLLIKHNNIIPQALYTEDNVCFTSSIYSLLHKNSIELKFLCGLMNSALMQFYCIYGINNQKDTTINLNQYMIRHFPFIRVNEEIKEEIAEKIDFIEKYMEHNNGNIDDTVLILLREIDEVVFKLYSISEDEKELLLKNVRERVQFFEKIYEKDYDFIFNREWTKIKRAPNF